MQYWGSTEDSTETVLKTVLGQDWGSTADSTGAVLKTDLVHFKHHSSRKIRGLSRVDLWGTEDSSADSTGCKVLRQYCRQYWGSTEKVLKTLLRQYWDSTGTVLIQY